MKKKIYIVGIFLLLLSIVVVVYYHSVFSRSVNVVTLIDKSESSQIIEIEYEDGIRKKIKCPEIVLPFLEEGKQYFIVIYDNIIRDPFIKSIEPSANSE